jgi:hypothetical protein
MPHVNLFLSKARIYNRLVRPSVAFHDAQLIEKLVISLCLDDAVFFTLKQAVIELARKEMTLPSFVASLQNFSASFPALVQAESARRGGEAQSAVFLTAPVRASSTVPADPWSFDSSTCVGAGSTTFGVAECMARYKVSAGQLKSSGKHPFPRRSGFQPENPGTNASPQERRKAFEAASNKAGKYLAALLGVPCTRCLRRREVCEGGKSPQCSRAGAAEYVDANICKALRALLTWSSFTKEKEIALPVIEAFYAQEGRSFGEFENQVVAHISEAVKGYSVTQCTDLVQVLLRSASSEAALKRALVALPDTGNPSIVAGECWWRDYLPLLRSCGLGTVRKASSPANLGFGDGPQKPPLYVLLQVPLWYALESGKTMVVFVNIRIVGNLVGVLDGKEDMSALKLKSQLSPEPGQSTFALLGKPVVVIDDGHHFFFQLRHPRAFASKETGYSLQRHNDGVVRAVEVVAKLHHKLARPFDDRLTLLPKQEGDEDLAVLACNSFSVLSDGGDEDAAGVIPDRAPNDCPVVIPPFVPDAGAVRVVIPAFVPDDAAPPFVPDAGAVRVVIPAFVPCYASRDLGTEWFGSVKFYL